MNCNKENHWDNILIYGECGGSCGLTKGFIQAEIRLKKLAETEIELNADGSERTEKDEIRSRYIN